MGLGGQGQDPQLPLTLCQLPFKLLRSFIPIPWHVCKVGTICPGFSFYQQVPGLESSISRPTYNAYLSCLRFPILSDQNWGAFEVGTCMGPHFAGDKTQEPHI